jgi:hypothetical protein
MRSDLARSPRRVRAIAVHVRVDGARVIPTEDQARKTNQRRAAI